MDLGIAGRRAAVAAASAGLGLAVADALLADGVAVAICGRDPQRLAAAAEGRDVVAIEADVSTPDGAAGFVRAARDALGGVDIVVGNAGGPPGGGFDDFGDPAQYADAFSLNALSTIAMCIEAVPAMRARCAQFARVYGLRQPAVSRIALSRSRTSRERNRLMFSCPAHRARSVLL